MPELPEPRTQIIGETLKAKSPEILPVSTYLDVSAARALADRAIAPKRDEKFLDFLQRSVLFVVDDPFVPIPSGARWALRKTVTAVFAVLSLFIRK